MSGIVKNTYIVHNMIYPDLLLISSVIMFFSFELLMPCGNKLVSPKLREGQELNGFMIHKVFQSKTMYIRPTSVLPVLFDTSDSEDSCVEVDTTSASNNYRNATTNQTRAGMTTRARGKHSSTQQISSLLCTRARANHRTASQQVSCDIHVEADQPTTPQQVSHEIITTSNQLPAAQRQVSHDTVSTRDQPTTSQAASSAIDLDSVTTVHQTSSVSRDNYASYLAIMSSTSDPSSDEEELNQAIMASLESHAVSECENSKSAREVLVDLASQIQSNRRCKFNINRSAVLDGAVRGFKRLSYNPTFQMHIKFSDDLGMEEEAVDLGGPRREFLRLLMEALALSPMFEGRDSKLNIALDSVGK